MNIIESLTVHNVQNDLSSSLALINEHWDNIPLYEPGDYSRGLPFSKNGMLCRFHGMIQDMPNPDIYFSKYLVVNRVTGNTELKNGKYLDSLVCGENETLELESENCENGERRPYFMIPVPGLTTWVRELKQQRKNDSASKIEKLVNYSHCDAKRSAEEMEIFPIEHGNNLSGSKRHCSKMNNERIPEPPDTCTRSLNDENCIGCLVVMYDQSEVSLKLNDVLEVVGFLYSEPLAVEEDEFDFSYRPPSPITPRLHCVVFKKVSNSNPYIMPSYNQHELLDNISTIRNDVELVLSQLLFGDNIVANYLLCHLISQIYHRDDSETVLGKFSLAICGLPHNYQGKEFYNVLSKLLPKVEYLALTIDNLNKSKLLPKKNYKTGRLEMGLLQLSNNTHLVIDEINLEEGRLDDTGVRNFNALSSLIKRQKLDYDFSYYTVGFTTDIPVVTLSQRKSLLPTDFRCTIKRPSAWESSMEECYDSVNQFLNEDLLKKIRIYLSIAANLPFSIPERFEKIIQEDFVNLRKEYSNFSAEDLHELLVLARFLTISYCETELSELYWEKAKSFSLSRRVQNLDFDAQ